LFHTFISYLFQRLFTVKNMAKNYGNSATAVPKNVWIKFTLKTDLPSPYETHWQVVNTGREAAADRQLRGDFLLK
jgi:Adenylyl/Guanylyl and SMODS C-terminal sensor domain